MRTLSFKAIICIICSLIFSIQIGVAQNDVIPLWENGIPQSKVAKDYIEKPQINKLGVGIRIWKVSEPTITSFLPKEKGENRPAVIIFPGGGYSYVSIDKEGYKTADWFNQLGIVAFVVKYRLPDDAIMTQKHNGPLQDAQQAIRYVRKHASKYGVDPNKIGVAGFSAGGHLAASASTLFDKPVYSNTGNISARPDFSILVYPVISMTDALTHQGSKINLLGESAPESLVKEFSTEHQITSKTPATFLAHAADDGAVPVGNCLVYYQQLLKFKVPSELHIYERGGHGFGLGYNENTKQWTSDLVNWLRSRGYVK